MSENQLVQLGRYGLIGVMLALISLVAISQWQNWKISTNHIEHTNQYLQDNTRAVGELSGTLGELKEVIRAIDCTK